MMKDIFLRVYQRPLLMEIETIKGQQRLMGEGEGAQEEEEKQPYEYNEMNPIGEVDEIEYMKE